MTKIGRKIVATLAAGGMMLGTFASTALGATYVNISDNGAFSENRVNIRQNQDIRINQSNRANIHNSIDIDANTGRNSANFNTGGHVFIRTGDIRTSVDIFNKVNSNCFELKDFGRNHVWFDRDGQICAVFVR